MADQAEALLLRIATFATAARPVCSNACRRRTNAFAPVSSGAR